MDMRIRQRKLFMPAAVLLYMLLFSAALLPTAHAAEPTYYYINASVGSDTNDGTSAARAVKTLTTAMRLAVSSDAAEAVFVLTDAYTLSSTASEVAHDMPFTFTTTDGKVDYGAKGAKLIFGKSLRFYLQGDTTFANIAIEYSGTLNFVAQYHSITFGKGVVTKRTDAAVSGAYVVGGWQSPDNSKNPRLDSHITIESGSFSTIVGGSRQRASGADGLVCTGTHYITINGGEIDTLYGASLEHNWNQNAVIAVNGGKIKTLYVGGDLTRRLNGNAAVTLLGGEIGTVHVNNVIGSATVTLAGCKVGSMAVSYYNVELEDMHRDTHKTHTLAYQSFYYTKAQMEACTGFDTLQNETVLYAAANASGTGLCESDPTSFASAMEIAARNGGTVQVIGTIPLGDFTEPTHTDAITIVGLNADSTLQCSGTYMLAGETVLDGVQLAGSGIFNAENGMLFTGSKVTSDASAKLCVIGSARLAGGSFLEISNAVHVVVDGATVDTVIGGSDAVWIELLNGSIGTVQSATDTTNSFSLSAVDGKVGKIIFKNVQEQLFYRLVGGTVAAYAVAGSSVRGTLVLDESKFTKQSLDAAADLFTVSDEKAFFLCDGAGGTGTSLADASSSLTEAYRALQQGGTLVICGKYTLTDTLQTLRNEKPVVITSVYDGVDYAATNAAELIFKTNFFCGGDTEFRDIVLAAGGRYLSIYGNCHTLILGENITTTRHEDSGTYLSVMGGNQSAVSNASSALTINSGIWQRVRGGTAANGSKNYTVSLTINGGEFRERLTLGSSESHSGDITATINGGTFYRGIYASTLSKAAYRLSSNISLTINGGTVYAYIAASSSGLGSYSGSFAVTISGGEFGHLTDLVGTETLSGSMTSALTVEDGIDIYAKTEGTMSFTNPIRANGADPWLFYHDGYYYYTATTGSALGLARAANIGDLPYAEYITVYDPEDGHMWSKNLWSPEIHYYTDEEIGEGNGGWYCYIACDNGDNLYHRMYVIKCLDGDNLLGRWGNPVTGEVNVPQKIEAKDIANFDNVWAAGQTDIRINGKLYMMYVTEAGRNTKDFHQTINLVAMTNPWTIVGQSSVICYPQYDWEKGGYAYNAVTGKASPMVVEGGTAVYAEDGTVYIVYSGSGYWTTEYKLGQMKYLGGDPLDIQNWEKLPTPIFSKSSEINGCGHASYVTDTDGQSWICYHAYIGKDTASGRYAFVEPYYADKNGVVIADGLGHPAVLDTVYTVKFNPMPLADKISGFTAIHAGAATVPPLETTALIETTKAPAITAAPAVTTMAPDAPLSSESTEETVTTVSSDVTTVTSGIAEPTVTTSGALVPADEKGSGTLVRIIAGICAVIAAATVAVVVLRKKKR